MSVVAFADERLGHPGKAQSRLAFYSLAETARCDRRKGLWFGFRAPLPGGVQMRLSRALVVLVTGALVALQQYVYMLLIYFIIVLLIMQNGNFI